MPQHEHFDVLVLGSGQGGQLIAWHFAQTGQRAAPVEHRWVGGSARRWRTCRLARRKGNTETHVGGCRHRRTRNPKESARWHASLQAKSHW